MADLSYLSEVAKAHARVETSSARMLALLDLADAVRDYKAIRGQISTRLLDDAMERLLTASDRLEATP